MSLVGFNSNTIYLVSTIILSVMVTESFVMINFVVIDVPTYATTSWKALDSQKWKQFYWPTIKLSSIQLYVMLWEKCFSMLMVRNNIRLVFIAYQMFITYDLQISH